MECAKSPFRTYILVKLGRKRVNHSDFIHSNQQNISEFSLLNFNKKNMRLNIHVLGEKINSFAGSEDFSLHEESSNWRCQCHRDGNPDQKESLIAQLFGLVIGSSHDLLLLRSRLGLVSKSDSTLTLFLMMM